jgi:hypothetical protein
VGLSATWLLANGISTRINTPVPILSSGTDISLLLQYASAGLAMGAAQILTLARPFEKWNKTRAVAEVTRIDFFHYERSAGSRS